jgi:hypothetical protein
MQRQPTNPFYVVLGLVGFLFTITAASYCMSVLRGIRPEPAAAQRNHPLEQLMDRHGTSLLAGQLIVLAIATVGAVAVDHFAGERLRRQREGEQAASGTAAPNRPVTDGDPPVPGSSSP